MSDNGSVGPTKGPWRTDPDCGHESVLGPNGAMVADCAIFGMSRLFQARGGSNVANARLIAAAPELAEALKLLVDRFDTIDGKPFVSPPDSPWSIARAALQKAGLSAGEGC